MSTFGEVLETARRAKGWTQARLASEIGTTQVAVSRYENDLRDPTPEVFARLADALGVTPEFFDRAKKIEGAMAIDAHMRRRATAQPSIWRQLEARLNMHRVHTLKLSTEVSVSATKAMPTFDPVFDDAESAARLLRAQWRLPAGPVKRLYPWLEAAGCLIIEEHFPSPRVDGMSQWIDDYPVMLINSTAPTDRKRLTASHELGHLVLHRDEISDDIEGDANRFAAELLMPADVIRPLLRNLTIGRLHDLKRDWGVSMQALIERAYSLDLLTAAARTRLYKTFSARGWRTKEPVSDELAPETPTLIARIGDGLRQIGLDDNEIARLAGYSNADHADLFVPRHPRGRLRSVTSS